MVANNLMTNRGSKKDGSNILWHFNNLLEFPVYLQIKLYNLLVFFWERHNKNMLWKFCFLLSLIFSLSVHILLWLLFDILENVFFCLSFLINLIPYFLNLFFLFLYNKLCESVVVFLQFEGKFCLKVIFI